MLSVTLHEDQTELNKLKDQLINLFQDQMELRRSLMEINNTSMEISLETTRNQLLVKRCVLLRVRDPGWGHTECCVSRGSWIQGVDTLNVASCCPVALWRRPIGLVWRLLWRRPNCSGSSWGDANAAQYKPNGA